MSGAMADLKVRQRPVAAFLFDLLQDVSVLRPIVRTLAQELDLDIVLLFSAQFEGRDKQQLWRAELGELALEHGAILGRFDSPFEVVRALQRGQGLLFSASESNLPAHAVNHNVFLAAPAGFVRITVQHGYECVGFNQNREQTLAHGSSVRFAADVLLGWVPKQALRHLCISERDKYFELGPPLLLNRLLDRRKPGAEQGIGLVCENLHSVRLKMTGDAQAVYLDSLLNFAQSEGKAGRKVAVRPHPGGQFLIKNKIELPQNVVLANKPMYKTDLAGFAYGISAPSSVLIDMVLARTPTAVWSDSAAMIDTSAYVDLAIVSTVQDWEAFAQSATLDPERYRVKQEAFLRKSGLDVDPQVIRDRLVRLVSGLLAKERPNIAPRRILLVANGVVPTLHISFLKPLANLAAEGHVQISVLTEKDILRSKADAKDAPDEGMAAFARDQIERLSPDLAVFCRYSGPAVTAMVERLQESGVPVIFHIDDDLLNVPRELGEKKFVEHNRSERTSTIRYLIDRADLVYCSTAKLKERFVEIGITRELKAGAIYCAGEVIAEAELREARTIGFMGNDKTPELTGLVPVIAKLLHRYPELRFELFGSMEMPEELAGFGDRVKAMAPISDYNEFVTEFSRLTWDIGLCPLHKTPFNVVKADTKWVDYTSIGAAVVASRDTAYNSCCSDGCGRLVDTIEEWEQALDALITDADARFTQIKAAQAKLRQRYSKTQLTHQVLDMFDAAANESNSRQSFMPAGV